MYYILNICLYFSFRYFRYKNLVEKFKCRKYKGKSPMFPYVEITTSYIVVYMY